MRTYMLSLFMLTSVLFAQAQEDSLQANKYVTRATLYGIGYTNILDTYLSPMEYTGTELRILKESMRMTKLMDGQVSTQSIFQLHLSYTKNKAETGREFSGWINWSLAWHYQFRFHRLKLLAGPMLDMNLGYIYNIRNSNNPAQAIANTSVDLSGMAVYHFQIRHYPLVARYQLNIPIAGIMFSPEYGQSYYEIFELKHDGKNVIFTTPANHPSFRQFISLDFPIGKVNLRAGYMCDIQQASVNHLKSHAWSHLFMIGLIKNFCVLKGKNKISLPTSVNPF
ncbi:DUF3316 domain-containing protein [Phocaeicola abscessus]|uniref:DUF3316 domain-containing protein n=1 Tax=Phocaeicola abscessus TaxID=555313 RepID=UPI00056050A2|nr:DUF3316 domain-containing protein [Phocaeicola abscessus]